MNTQREPSCAVNTVVVAGNPKQGSRTLEAAVNVAGRLGLTVSAVIDLITLGSDLMEWGHPAVKEAIGQVASADVAVVASPTFKGTYTGVLKLFLDQFAGGSLASVYALPVMLGASLKHSMAPETSLRPVLVELGASCPVAGLYLLDSCYLDSPELDEWIHMARRQLAGLIPPDTSIPQGALPCWPRS